MCVGLDVVYACVCACVFVGVYRKYFPYTPTNTHAPDLVLLPASYLRMCECVCVSKCACVSMCVCIRICVHLHLRVCEGDRH